MPSTPSSSTTRRPTVDEWGVYDPKQAGLAALFSRLTTPPALSAAPPATDLPKAQPAPRALGHAAAR